MAITHNIHINNSKRNDILFNYEYTILHNDFALNKKLLKPKSLDLIITSPPYNIGIEYNSNTDCNEYKEYLEFCKIWLKNCYFWAKDGARFCLNIPLDKNKGGQQSVGADITTIAKKAGWNYHSTIVWNEGNISRRTAWGSWLSASAPYVITPVELKEKFKTNRNRQENVSKNARIC